MSLRDWWRARKKLNWSKVLRRIGRGLAVVVVIVVGTIVGTPIVSRLFEAIVKGTSEDVRNYGLLLSGIVGAILVGWRNLVAAKQADLQD